MRRRLSVVDDGGFAVAHAASLGREPSLNPSAARPNGDSSSDDEIPGQDAQGTSAGNPRRAASLALPALREAGAEERAVLLSEVRGLAREQARMATQMAELVGAVGKLVAKTGP